jgi:hypothetical protein
MQSIGLVLYLCEELIVCSQLKKLTTTSNQPPGLKIMPRRRRQALSYNTATNLSPPITLNSPNKCLDVAAATAGVVDVVFCHCYRHHRSVTQCDHLPAYFIITTAV